MNIDIFHRNGAFRNDYQSKIRVPQYMLDRIKVSRLQTIAPFIVEFGALLGRAAINVRNDVTQAPEWLKWLNAGSFHILQLLQQAPSAEKLNPELIIADTALSLIAVATLGWAINKGVDMFRWRSKVQKIQEDIMKSGNLTFPVGLVRHPVLLTQQHSFLPDLLEDMSGLTGQQPFLMTQNNDQSKIADPYAKENQKDGEPLTAAWLQVPKPYDDKSLHVADINTASELVILTTQTDRLVLSSDKDMGISTEDALNTVVTAYGMKKKSQGDPLHILLFLPSRSQIRIPVQDIKKKKKSVPQYRIYQSAEEYLKRKGISLEHITIQYMDEMLADEIRKKGPVSRMSVDNEYYDPMIRFLNDPKYMIQQTPQGKGYTVVYKKKDGKALFDASGLDAEDKPLLIIDDKKDISEAHREGIRYICIQEMIEEQIRQFMTHREDNERIKQLHHTRLESAMEGFFGVDEAILHHAHSQLGNDLLKLVELLPSYSDQINVPTKRFNLSASYHVWHEAQMPGKRYHSSNANIMYAAMRRNNSGNFSATDLAKMYYHASLPSKDQIGSMDTLLQALYGLGLVFRIKGRYLDGKWMYVYGRNEHMDIAEYLNMMGVHVDKDE